MGWLGVLSGFLRLARWAAEQATRRQLMNAGANQHLAETLSAWHINIKNARKARATVEFFDDRSVLRHDPDARHSQR
jgi:transcription antitermination factor NusA-like protein